MRKLIILTTAMLTACTLAPQDRGVRQAELTMDHLDPLTICASEINFNHDEEVSAVTKALAMWYEEVLKLDNSCPKTADFNLKEATIKKSHLGDLIVYDETISAELVITSISGKLAKAKASAYNKLSFGKNATLTEKEEYVLELNEKTIADFDKAMRESVNKYLR